jgi:hypothetical protein
MVFPTLPGRTSCGHEFNNAENAYNIADPTEAWYLRRIQASAHGTPTPRLFCTLLRYFVIFPQDLTLSQTACVAAVLLKHDNFFA